MKKITDFFKSLKWVLFVSRRFSRVDRKGRSAITSFLASTGICFGVMTLITVISVMNGFQMSFIDSIMEVSSYHIRAKKLMLDSVVEYQQYCWDNKDIKVCFPFYEAQSLIIGQYNSQAAALIRAIPKNIMTIDSGFKKEAVVTSGKFDLSEKDSIVLGSDLARRLGVRVGSSVNLFALSGGSDISLISNDRIFTVTGIVRTGYSDINNTYAFISIDDGVNYFGKNAPMFLGIKLYDTNNDIKVMKDLSVKFPTIETESWKDYNRSFFGVLRIEKNMLMLLVFIIFLVVSINIFNGLRRMVFERREEISVLSAFGGSHSLIQTIFIMQGFLIGVKGSIPGLILGLLLSVRMSSIFIIMSKIVYYIQVFFVKLIIPSNAPFIRENPMYMVYANIPPRIYISEVLAITVFGIFSALLASWVASRGVLKLTVAEVMRNE